MKCLGLTVRLTVVWFPALFLSLIFRTLCHCKYLGNYYCFFFLSFPRALSPPPIPPSELPPYPPFPPFPPFVPSSHGIQSVYILGQRKDRSFVHGGSLYMCPSVSGYFYCWGNFFSHVEGVQIPPLLASSAFTLLDVHSSMPRDPH